MYRNFVNTVDVNVPDEWEVKEGEQKNIKWSAELGSLAYGGPIVADGKVVRLCGTKQDVTSKYDGPGWRGF